MIHTIQTALDRNSATLVQDAIGVIALAVILVGALHLPLL